VRLLSSQGFELTAVTGKTDQHQFLQDIGATKVLDRTKFLAGSNKLLLRERWAGVVDTVGGEYLAGAIKGTCYDGVVTSCGNAASGDLPLSVFPFILRGVTLSGIDSANCQMSRRIKIWRKLADSWKISGLESLCRTVNLGQLSVEIDSMLQGNSKGRVVVDLQEKI
jgi:putative YhdH/YhfP family quinone oxidoreductase